jgi:hypothetical protein
MTTRREQPSIKFCGQQDINKRTIEMNLRIGRTKSKQSESKEEEKEKKGQGKVQGQTGVGQEADLRKDARRSGEDASTLELDLPEQQTMVLSNHACSTLDPGWIRLIGPNSARVDLLTLVAMVDHE